MRSRARASYLKYRWRSPKTLQGTSGKTLLFPLVSELLRGIFARTLTPTGRSHNQLARYSLRQHCRCCCRCGGIAVCCCHLLLRLFFAVPRASVSFINNYFHQPYKKVPRRYSCRNICAALPELSPLYPLEHKDDVTRLVSRLCAVKCLARLLAFQSRS